MESWRAELAAGHRDAAWDRFIEAYRSLILATIRHAVPDPEEVMDVFAHVCGELSANNLQRLLAFERRAVHEAKFSSWLVVVVRNQAFDYLRRQHGRPRARPPAGLSELERAIFQLVFVQRVGHAEAYERLRSTRKPPLSFSAFLRALRVIHRTAGDRRPGAIQRRSEAAAPVVDESPLADRVVETGERITALQRALELLPPESRLALQLYVLDEMPATEVARVLGWPNAKAVYNSVYRSLAVLREELKSKGIDSASP